MMATPNEHRRVSMRSRIFKRIGVGAFGRAKTGSNGVPTNDERSRGVPGRERQMQMALLACAIVGLVTVVKYYVLRGSMQGNYGASALLERYPMSNAWEGIALNVEPIVDPLTDVVLVPSRKVVMTDLVGECAFENAAQTARGLNGTVCERFLRFDQAGDQHVTASFLSELPGGCTDDGFVLDIGSNFGYYTGLFRVMGCRVLAIDPQPAMNQFHLASLDANGWLHDGSVSLIEGFVGNESKHQPLAADMRFWSPNGRGKDANPRGVVKAGTMMRYVDIKDLVLCDLENNQRTEFVKLDIDGPEGAIFEDIVQFMVDGCIRAMIAEITWKVFPQFGPSHDDAMALFGRLYDSGYNVYHVYPELDANDTSNLEQMMSWRAFSSTGADGEVYRVPRDHLREVLDSRGQMTKNLYITKLE